MGVNKDIYINGRFLSHKTDGISRFSVEICKQLMRLGVKIKILVPKWLKYDNQYGFELVRTGNLRSHFWEQIDLLYFLRKHGNPLLLNFSGLGPLFYKNQIITIHDLSFYENKKWFSKSYTLLYGFATPIAARNAMKIFTVSDFSRTEIIKFLKVGENKIDVIYNAVSTEVESSFTNEVTSANFEYLFNNKYILAVSSIDPRKNLQRLIDAFVELNLNDYKLVLVGKTANHFNVNLSSVDKNILFTGFVSDADLCFLYKNCEFFVYPSLYEGFGIPPLEAMKNGCAVIASEIPSLTEVCSDAAYYVNPYDIQNMKDAILTMVSNTSLKEGLKVKGAARSRFFTWEESGKKVYNSIQTLII